MSREQAEYLVNTIIRENSFGQIPGDRAQAQARQYKKNPYSVRSEQWYVTLSAPGWTMHVREDTPEARMALLSMCCDLGKMLRSGEYDEHVREAAL